MSPQPSPRSRRGFTLVELLVTLVVLTMIMGATVVFFQGQNRSFIRGGEDWDLLQNARYAVGQVERVLRTLGTGVTGQQPMLVYGGPNGVAFNTDFVETDTTDYRWAVHFNPSVDPALAIAWDASASAAIPTSSPGYPYPTVTYRLANGAPAPAETKTFWFALDSATARPDDYILYERTNAGPAEYLARNLLPYPGRPFFEYFLVRRIESTDTLIVATDDLLPLARPLAGTGPAAARPDSVRMVRLNLRVTNGLTGALERTRDFSQIIPVPNNGMPSPAICGRDPLPPVGLTATPDTVGSGRLTLAWGRSPDHGDGEQDVRQYILYQRDDTATVWADPLLTVKADTATVYAVPVGGLVPGRSYRFGVAAQDCTPAQSSIQAVLGTAP